MWHIRIQGAIERESEQYQNQHETMEKFIRRVKRVRQQRLLPV